MPTFTFASPTRVLVSALVLSLCNGCKDDPPPDGTAETGGDDAPADLPAGSTAIVVIVNPVVNDGHQTGVPSVLTEVRDEVDVDAEPGGDGITDLTGLTVVEAEPGPTVLRFGPDDDDQAELGLSVVADGDVYDAPVAWDGVAAEGFDGTPIRYAVGNASGAIFLDPETPLLQIEDELAEDEAVVVLRPGVYVGDLTIRGRDVLLFGEGFSEAAVTIDGSIQASGEAVRLRGLSVEGDVVAEGNNFGMSFMVVRGETRITGNGGAFLRNVFCGDVVIPSGSATLLDNYGLAPLADVPAERCAPADGGADSTG
jgi:hypothetical protein